MSTTELASLVGRRCIVSVGKLRFCAHIVDAARQYGNDRVKVEPDDGTGAGWKNLDAIELIDARKEAGSWPSTF